MLRYLIILVIACFLLQGFSFCQDQGTYQKQDSSFWTYIQDEIAKFDQKKPPEPKRFRMDFSGKQYPLELSTYTMNWHNDPISQGNSGTCWDFCTTSFYESEIYRLSGRKVKLSEMYTAYWETVEKCRGFIRTRGNSLVAEGSQSSAVKRIWKKYGIVPAEAYTGMKEGQKVHNHETMYAEINGYLASIKASNAWNEEQSLATIKAILNHYLGEPPTTVCVDGKTMTPQEYLASLPIVLDNYIELISLARYPYYELTEYEVPDNWWHSCEYFNIPLEDFMSVLRYALPNGYTLVLGGDVSEPGYSSPCKIGVVPDFDIPSSAINEQARLFRFENHTTTDDHGIHCIGWQNFNGQNWYVIKDSGSGSRHADPKGYVFYHEDYIKLKMMNILVHKDATGSVWTKYQEFLKKNK